MGLSQTEFKTASAGGSGMKNVHIQGAATILFAMAISLSVQAASSLQLPPPSDLSPPAGAPNAPGDAFPVTFGNPPAANTPVIAAWNESVRADESLTLTGINFTVRTSTDTGSDTTVWVWGQSGTSGILDQAKIWKLTPSLLTMTLPASLPYGMFLIWVENANGAGAPVAVNRTNPQWIGPLGNSALRGSLKRVFGKDLSTGHGTTQSFVYIQPKSGGVFTAATVTRVEPYAVEFTVPNLPDGTYNVYVHNGHGGQYGWGAPLDLILAAPFARDTNTLTITPSGGDDAPAIQNAINTQSARANGGVVSLLAGVYTIKSAVHVAPRVKLVGAGKNNTTIAVRLNASAHDALSIDDNTDVSGLTVKLYLSAGMPIYGIAGSGDNWPAIAHDFRMNDVQITAESAAMNYGNNMGFLFNRAEISNSIFDREFKVQTFVSGSPVTDVWFHNNTFHGGPYNGQTEGAQAGLSVDQAERFVIENNYTETPKWTAPMPNDGLIARRMFLATPLYGPNVHLYVAHNTTKDVAPVGTGNSGDDENKGEMILFHGDGAAWYGEAISATGLTTTVRTDGKIDGQSMNFYNNNGYITYSGSLTDPLNQVRTYGQKLDNAMFATIMGGTGIGQTRRVISHTSNSFTVDSPWRVIPAADSKIVLSYLHKDNVIYQNTLNAYPASYQVPYGSSASTTIQLDALSIGNVTEGNVGHRTFAGRMSGGSDLAPCYWNDFRNDSMFEVQRAGIELTFWHLLNDTQVYPNYTIDLLGPVTLGNAFRGQTVQIIGPQTNYFQEQVHQFSAYLYRWTQWTVGSPFEYHVGNIVEHFTGSGGRRGLEEGDWSETLFRANNITVDDTTLVPQNDFQPPQPEYQRQKANPILTDNIYSGGSPIYTAENGNSFAKILPLYHVARFTPGAAPATTTIPVQNSGIASGTWSARADQAWISTAVVNATLASESAAGSLSITVDPTTLPAGVTWGMVRIVSGTTSVPIGVRVEKTAIPLTVNASPATVAAGSSVTASWSGATNATATDWLSVKALSAPDYSVSVVYAVTGGGSSGTVSMKIPAGTAPGQYEIRYYYNDTFTLLAKSNSFTVVAESPFGGTPWPIPGTIEAENFDEGGAGIAYNDTTAGNTGGSYRSTDVDIRQCVDAGGGYQAGWTDGGEWLNYTVNVATTGKYVMTERVASGQSGSALHIEFDGNNLTGSITVPNTGSWDTWLSLSQTVTLSAGKHILRMAVDNGGFDLNYIQFVAVNSTISSQVNSGGAAVGSFKADTGFSGGNTYATTAAIITTGITNPAPQAVYQSERYGNFTYTIGGLTGGAAYTVRLHFAEIYWNAAGSRVFNVAINGSAVLTNFDIYVAAGGKNTAIIKSFTASANSSGQIVVTYTTVKDNAKSSGIEVLSGAAPTGALAASLTPDAVDAQAAAAAPAIDSGIGSIDLGMVKLNKSFKLPLPSPETGAAGKKLRWTTVGPLPKGVKLSAGIIAGRPSAAGTFTFKVQVAVKNASTTTAYTLTVIP
jgi:hypothetical protein